MGRLSLEELWRAVDKVRVGGRGHAVLVDETGRLLAHGDPAMRASVARGEDLLWHPLIHPKPGATLAGVERYTTDKGVEMLGVARPVGARGWRIIVEQRAVEAFALSTRLERFLVMTVLTGLALTLFIAVIWGRSFVRPLDALMRGTRSLAEGRLQDRVAIAGRDEFTELGRAFNSMADRLVTLQAEAVRQERQATFGRIAAGLVHDLAHPIQNIGNNCRLMLQLYEDPQYRQDFRRMIDREFPAIRRLLEDLRNLARPIPLERFPVDVARLLQETAERINPIAAQAGLTVTVSPPATALAIEGDLFALGRVLQNLLQNALQATPPNGRVWLSMRELDGRAVIEVGDTGCGIAAERLPHVFDDYVTTKRRGLGLGLAISRRIVEQLGGTIAVTSEVGKGSVFTLSFPAIPAQRLLQQASARAENGRPNVERAPPRVATEPASRRCCPYLERADGRCLPAREDGVLHLLRDARLHDRLGRDLDGLARRGVAPHARLRLAHVELDHAGQRELARSLELLLRELGEVFEELTSLRALPFEPFREMREQLGLAHLLRFSHCVASF